MECPPAARRALPRLVLFTLAISASPLAPGFAPAVARGVARAQSPARAAAPGTIARALATTHVEFAEPFSAVANLIELADGRVLLFDAIERRLGIADLARGSFTAVAQQGAGPMEYRTVGAALRIAGDSVLLWDPGNARIMALSRDGAPLGAWPSTGRDARTTALARDVPREVDDAGRFYAALRRVSTGDTTTLVRIAPATGRQDTLARYATPQLRPVRSAQSVVKVIAPGFPAQDAWGVFPDGRVLFIHGADYVPEVIRPDGTRMRAAAIPFERVTVGAVEKDQHLKEAAAELERMLRRELGRGSGTMPRIEAEPPAAWPAVMPPIRDAHVRVDSRRRAWVLIREGGTPAGDRYDLLDADGRRIDAIRLPAGMRLVGMGKDVLYLTREDGDGLQYLRRYPLP